MSIRVKLQLELGGRDVALFNLAMDSKLRGAILLRVDDVAPQGYAIDRANVRQRQTGRPVRFELTEQTPAVTRICAAAVASRGRFCFRAEAAQIDL